MRPERHPSTALVPVYLTLGIDDIAGTRDNRKDSGLEFLFDSKGRHIATLVDRHIHDVSGTCIGYRHPELGIFVDLEGRYLGEVAFGDRLMYNLLSIHCTALFESCPETTRVDIPVPPASREAIDRISRFVDIAPVRLEAPRPIRTDQASSLTGLGLLIWAGRFGNAEGLDLLLPYL